ncbi:MAG: hypothetical protein AAGF47_12500 [Planctomycetota bacterium]
MPTILAALLACPAIASTDAVAGASLARAPSAAADGFVDRINAAFARVPSERRSDLVILPVLAEMDAPPAILQQRAGRAALILTSSPVWPAASEWAAGDAQQAALDALRRVTEETNPRRAMVFALPYGIGGVPRDLIRAGLHAELGDPPALAGARLGYMPKITDLRLLVSIETTRLADQGRPRDAIDLNLSLAAFGRQFADRAFGVEVLWAYSTMAAAFERIRDVAYVDGKAGRDLTADDLTEVVGGLDLDRGLFRPDRLVVPEGDRVAALQMIDRVFGLDGRPDLSVFPTTLAEMAASGRPLRLFAEAGRWSQAAGPHADADATREAVNGVFADWMTRWNTDPFDRLQRSVPAYRQLDQDRFALVQQIVPDLSILIDARRGLRTELNGTRVALALQALTLATGGRASSLAIVRPRYIDSLGDDPFNPDRAAGNTPELRYFVPERDTVGNQRHRMNVVPVGGGGANFSTVLTRDDFVLYSVGPNESDDRAVNVSDSSESRIGDYLIWPPITSLTREFLALTNASE